MTCRDAVGLLENETSVDSLVGGTTSELAADNAADEVSAADGADSAPVTMTCRETERPPAKDTAVESLVGGMMASEVAADDGADERSTVDGAESPPVTMTCRETERLFENETAVESFVGSTISRTEVELLWDVGAAVDDVLVVVIDVVV